MMKYDVALPIKYCARCAGSICFSLIINKPSLVHLLCSAVVENSHFCVFMYTCM